MLFGDTASMLASQRFLSRILWGQKPQFCVCDQKKERRIEKKTVWQSGKQAYRRQKNHVRLREFVADPRGTHVHSRFIQYDDSPFLFVICCQTGTTRTWGADRQPPVNTWREKLTGARRKQWSKRLNRGRVKLISSVTCDPLCHHYLLVLQKKRHTFKSSLGVIIRQEPSSNVNIYTGRGNDERCMNCTAPQGAAREQQVRKNFSLIAPLGIITTQKHPIQIWFRFLFFPLFWDKCKQKKGFFLCLCRDMMV